MSVCANLPADFPGDYIVIASSHLSLAPWVESHHHRLSVSSTSKVSLDAKCPRKLPGDAGDIVAIGKISPTFRNCHQIIFSGSSSTSICPWSAYMYIFKSESKNDHRSYWVIILQTSSHWQIVKNRSFYSISSRLFSLEIWLKSGKSVVPDTH